MKKVNKPYKWYLDNQSEFSHRCACWANNHNGWAKAKKCNKRIAKKRERRALKKQVEDMLDEE